jgi:ribosomal protein S18 acetylase RimI-like enzyme
VTLWVLEENARAIAFYRALGFLEDGQAQSRERAGRRLVEIRMRRPLTAR